MGKSKSKYIFIVFIFYIYCSHIDLLTNENDFLWQNYVKNQNSFYQKQLADRINVGMIETFQLLTSTLNVHLTKDQTMIIDTPSAFMKLNKTDFKSIRNRSIEHIENAQIHIPLNLNANISNDTIILLRIGFYLLNLCIFRSVYILIFDF